MTGQACLNQQRIKIVSGSLPKSATSTKYSLSVDGANDEVLVCYPAEGNTFPNRVLVYSWLDNVPGRLSP